MAKKKKATRRKKATPKSVGLSTGEVRATDDARVRELTAHVEDDGGAVLGAYNDPFGGAPVLLVALPIDKVEPTPYQRDPSEPHVKRLMTVIEKVGRFLDPLVIVRDSDQYWTPKRLQRLAWDMEGTGAEMVVAPVLMEVAGPRLNVTGVLGMPLLRVTAPMFTGGRRVVKEIVDRCGSALLLTLLSPLLLVIAVAIKLNDRGPVIYRQRRVGRDGATFTMLKFRTMVTDADAIKQTLAADNEGAGPLFKMKRDPRITRVGGFLRRYSLDEVPQLFNVVSGKMSLVGPRPPLPEETEQYAPDARRRLLVKPGLTGLWQVSGRSDLTWAESIRLDLRYVEDWSLALDLMILWKTFRAVMGGQGAY